MLDAARGLGLATNAKSQSSRTKKQPGLAGWWERYRLYRDQNIRKPGALGVWIVFFSLAALPLFGLGQACIPPENLARRQYAFSLLIVYVGSGLSLLLITNFLSLAIISVSVRWPCR